MEITPAYLFAALQIIGIDILLSGDNAVVIAMACRALPEKQRRIGVILGVTVAITLRVLFALVTNELLGIPWLKAIGAVLLLWIAVKLLLPETGDEHVTPQDSLWRAVRTVAIADAVMSLDNVVAIAAVAKGDVPLLVFGLVVSIPLVMVGSQIILKLIDRFPVIVWAGAGLLGWVAGELFAEDPGITGTLNIHLNVTATAVAGALFVLAAGFFLRRQKGIGLLDKPAPH